MTNRIQILALDPATATGWAWGDGIEVVYGTWNLDLRDHPGAHLAMLERHLEVMREERPFDLLAFEHASQGSHNRRTVEFHEQLRGVALLFAARHRLAVDAINPSTLKKFATNSGRAKKDQMMRAAKFHGYNPANDNEADAIFLLLLAQQRQRIAAVVPERKAPRRKKRERLLF